ncbi:uncharacterized BrkB/YihY/UPF0761 family membrane protein [Mucilaginibacter sp. SG538B]|nr:uncharacterized BrkB/YihY/UPF0761 family membrane protein [Mucilaginibacter sp. SG538B]
MQKFLSSKIADNSLSLSLAFIAFLTFILGMIISVGAAIISMLLLPPDIKCAIGCVGLVPLGFLLLMFTTPTIYTIYVVKLKKKRPAANPPVV